MSLTARSADILFICQIISVMSHEECMKKINERNAAHLLMTKFVEREADDIASALECIIPMYFEITYDGLEKSMSVVNQTFASVALQLIKHNSCLDPEDPDCMTLPVGAGEMQDALTELSKFIHSMRTLLFMLYDKHHDDPAVKLADETFSKYDAQM